MSLVELTEFFQWCTILNVGLLLLWSIAFFAMPDLVYKTQRKFVPISRETFNVFMYAFLGAYKLLVIVFAVIPWIALVIMTK